MNIFLRSKRILTLAAFITIALAVFAPLAGSQSALAHAHTTKSSETQSLQSPLPSELSSGPLIAEAIRSGAIHVVSFNSQQPNQGAKLECPPGPCVMPDRQVSGGNPPGTMPVNETPIAADPKTETKILTGGNDYNCASLQGFFITVDQGVTWKSTCGTPLPNECGQGDPIVGYDLKGFAYIGGLDALKTNCTSTGLNAIAIQRSNNGGKTWSAPRQVVKPVLKGGTLDKPWLQVDDNPKSPRVNALYVCTTQFGPGNKSTIAVSRSTDRGGNWATTRVDAVQTFPRVDQFCDLAIGKDGTVYLSWMRCIANGPQKDCGGTQATFFMSSSKDGGKTWSKLSVIAKPNLTPDTCGGFYGCIPNTMERVSNIPSIGIQHADFGKSSDLNGSSDDGTNSSALKPPPQGILYATYYNWTGTQMQVLVVASKDGGNKWGKPVPVAPNTAKNDQFFPWLSVNEDGIVGVTWLDRRNDPNNISYQAFATVSKDGAVTFETNVQIASAASNPNNDGFAGKFMGDYTGNSFQDECLYTSWMDSRNGTNMQNWVGGWDHGKGS